MVTSCTIGRVRICDKRSVRRLSRESRGLLLSRPLSSCGSGTLWKKSTEYLGNFYATIYRRPGPSDLRTSIYRFFRTIWQGSTETTGSETEVNLREKNPIISCSIKARANFSCIRQSIPLQLPEKICNQTNLGYNLDNATKAEVGWTSPF